MISLADLKRRIDKGEISPDAALAQSVAAIEAQEKTIGAFVCRAGNMRAQHEGPLRGIAVGIKDIIETEDMPTEQGSPLFAGYRTGRDAATVVALREAGAPEPAVLAGDWSASSGYELGGLLAVGEPGLTAVFCGNDTMALGVIRAMSERGLRVPNDVSVIGFDDVPEAGYYLPPLTTVRQDFGVLGRQALSTLVDRMSRAIPAGCRVRVAPELIIRASAAGPG